MRSLLEQRRYGAYLALVTVGAAGIAAWFFAPRFALWQYLGPAGMHLVPHPETHRATDVLLQLRDPLAEIANPSNRAIEWRLLFPALGYGLGLPRPVFFALPHLGCLLVVAWVTDRTWRATDDRLAAAGAGLLSATTSWFFVSTGWLGYFDSWLVLGLLVVALAGRRAFVVAACLLGPWIGERFAIGLPAALLCRYLLAAHEGAADRAIVADAAAAAIGVAPYMAIRLGAPALGQEGASYLDTGTWSHAWARKASAICFRLARSV